MLEEDSTAVDDQLFDAARNGDAVALTALLDEHPGKLHVRTKPHEQTLLHLAAFGGHLEAVDLLLKRGIDANARDDAIKGDNTYAMHWAAAAGHLDVVRRLADAGGDVIGHGDDHELEVIGWATAWDGSDDPAHHEIADFLVSRGARHHIFSAIAFNLADEVRRIVAYDPAALHSRQSRNENHRPPLHFAVFRNRPEMVALLLELGADPLGPDGSGYTASVYATSPDADRPILEAVRARGAMDLFTAVALGEWETASGLLNENPRVAEGGDTGSGVLHLMAKRNNLTAVKWLLDHGADPNARWAHWDAEVTPLHLAVLAGHTDVVRLLLAAGADPTIRDSKHDSDAIGWAEFFEKTDLVLLLHGHASKS